MGRTGAVLRQVHTLFGVGTYAGLSDAQLLERFTSQNGEAAELAFAVLVERHGPMVFRVCRGVLHDTHEAHDAFQATFLVLVRKAPVIRSRESVGSWLHGVALRVASCARSSAARRKRHEHRVPLRDAEAMSDDDRADLESAVHEEVGRLPDRYRVPILLCYFEGLTQEDAAARLGWPIGTVRSRLARARERLRAKLSRRGLAPTSAAVAVILTCDTADAAVPPALVEATIRVALVGTLRRLTTAGTVSASVVALSGEVAKVMLMTKLRSLAVALMATAAIATGAGVLAQQAAGPAGSDANTKQGAITTPAGTAAQAAPGSGDKEVREALETLRRLNVQVADQKRQLEATENELKRAEAGVERAAKRVFDTKAGSDPNLRARQVPGATDRNPTDRPMDPFVTSRVPGPTDSEHTSRAPIADGRLPADEPPSESEILRTLINARFTNVHTNAERVAEDIERCRVYPLVGPCNLLTTRYKCTVEFDERLGNRTEHRSEVVYVDKSRLLRCNDAAHAHATEDSVKRSELERAEDRVDWAQHMFSKGYISKAQRAAYQAELDEVRAKLIPDVHPPSNVNQDLMNNTGDSGQERRLRDVERKLDRILDSLQKMKPAPAPEKAPTDLRY